jgi:hypothetical protein
MTNLVEKRKPALARFEQRGDLAILRRQSDEFESQDTSRVVISRSSGRGKEVRPRIKSGAPLQGALGNDIRPFPSRTPSANEIVACNANRTSSPDAIWRIPPADRKSPRLNAVAYNQKIAARRLAKTAAFRSAVEGTAVGWLTSVTCTYPKLSKGAMTLVFCLMTNPTSLHSVGELNLSVQEESVVSNNPAGPRFYSICTNLL